jgi:hypothetical protein
MEMKKIHNESFITFTSHLDCEIVNWTWLSRLYEYSEFRFHKNMEFLDQGITIQLFSEHPEPWKYEDVCVRVL